MSLISRWFGKMRPISAPTEKAAGTPEQQAPEQMVPEPSIPIRSVQTANQEAALRTAIENGDFRVIGELVTKGSSTKIRQLAAEAIEDDEQVRELIKAMRGGNDKSVYKILARKRDALLAKERQHAELQAEISAAAAAIERHSRRAYDALFVPTLEQMEIRWQAVAAKAELSVVRSTQDAIDRCREVIAQYLRNIAAQASRELAAANAAAEAQRIKEENDKAAAILAAERTQALEAERKAQAEKRDAEALFARNLGGLLRKAFGALSDGNTSRAASLRGAIEEKLAGAPTLPPYLAHQLQQLDTKLNELKDWKSFSVAPKRSELIEEMESLIDATVDPPVLAERIKALQEDWRTLSKGAGENVAAEWQRFHDAAQKAYQPCREYFEAQAKIRQENLQRREALCERLAVFESGQNWEQPDWRNVIAVLRESKLEWRRHSPVDRGSGNVVRDKFQEISARLQSRVDAEYLRNVKEKNSLIAAAQRLLAAEDSHKAADELKNLQRRWKSVGPVPRDQDQTLWEEFRTHSDAFFQQRQQSFAERNAELETHKTRAVELCESLEKIAGLSGTELLEGAKQLPNIRNAFESVGELPREAARTLRKRFDRAVEQCESALSREHARDGEQRWAVFFDVANRVRAYRFAIANGAESAEQERLKQVAESAIAAIAKWPKGGIEAIKSALADASVGAAATNDLALRKLCIRAEILTDTPTPPGDQTLRREYQLQRLVESMGQGAATGVSQLDTLALEWVCIGPVDEATYVALLERFVRSRHTANGVNQSRHPSLSTLHAQDREFTAVHFFESQYRSG